MEENRKFNSLNRFVERTINPPQSLLANECKLAMVYEALNPNKFSHDNTRQIS